MASTIKIFKNDTAPNVTFTLTRTDGTIVDLTACTVTFKIQDPTTGVRTNDSNNSCTVTNAAGGICTYAWTSTDLPDPGTYTANLVVTHAGNRVETYGVTIQVTDIV